MVVLTTTLVSTMLVPRAALVEWSDENRPLYTFWAEAVACSSMKLKKWGGEHVSQSITAAAQQHYLCTSASTKDPSWAPSAGRPTLFSSTDT